MPHGSGPYGPGSISPGARRARAQAPRLSWLRHLTQPRCGLRSESAVPRHDGEDIFVKAASRREFLNFALKSVPGASFVSPCAGANASMRSLVIVTTAFLLSMVCRFPIRHGVLKKGALDCSSLVRGFRGCMERSVIDDPSTEITRVAAVSYGLKNTRACPGPE